MKTTTSLIAAVIALTAAPALAGSPEVAPSQDAVTQAAPAALGSPDWTGFYGGVQLGYANVDSSAGGDQDEFIGGLTGGYDLDLGQWVIGAGIDYDFTDASINGTAASLEEIFRLKARGGYKIGNGLLYATGGYALGETDIFGSDDGYFIGGGYEHLVSSNFSVGGELLYNDFDNFNSTGTSVDATTVQIRGTFRF